jgi:hypothetical protein
MHTIDHISQDRHQAPQGKTAHSVGGMHDPERARLQDRPETAGPEAWSRATADANHRPETS